MARLSTGDAGLLTLDQALARIAARFQPTAEVVRLPLAAAAGRALVAPVIARVSVPPRDNSAVDGYACRHQDLPGTLPVIGRAAAGHPFAGTVGAGQALRIFTGAVMPDGADTVVMQEDAVAGDGTVTLPAGLLPGANRRHAGEDVQQGASLFSAGHRLGAAEIGQLAAVGIGEVDVRRPLRVAVFSNGDELADPAAAGVPASGRIYDSNRPMLVAALAAMGCIVTDLGILPDRRAAIEPALAEAAATHDAILSSAGMSVGDEDHVRAAIGQLGALDFWSLAIKPGRPVAIGHVAGTPCFGLPGNPVAALLTLLLVVRPALLHLGGETFQPWRRLPVAAGFSLQRKTGRREFLRGNLQTGADGRLSVTRYPRDGVGILSSVVESDGLIELAEDQTGIAEGATVPFLTWSALGLS